MLNTLHTNKTYPSHCQIRFPANEEYVSFVYLRILCIVQIYFTHYFAGHELRDYMWVFNLGVPSFLLMSAYLYGIRRTEATVLGWKFVLKRFVRLSVVVYPFIIVVFVYSLLESPESTKIYIFALIGDLLYQNAFFPHLPNCGHLWFLNTLWASYISLVIVNRFKFVSVVFRSPKCLLVVLVGVVSLGLIYKGANVPYVLFYLIIYYNAHRIKSMKKLPYVVCIVIFLIHYILSYLHYWERTPNGHYLTLSQNLLATTFVLILFLKIGDSNLLPKNRILNFVSLLTFEFYLVHHLFVFDYSMIVGLLISIPLTLLLHECSLKLLCLYKFKS